jgi:hypothetical protein
MGWPDMPRERLALKSSFQQDRWVKHSSDLPLTIRPIVAMDDEYPSGFVDPYHAHERSQLSYAISGVMAVVTQARSFILPPRRGSRGSRSLQARTRRSGGNFS